MDLIADGLLLATALAAGLYCFVLAQRLRRLSDARSGIGAQIEALNGALGETRAALAETRKGIAEARGSARGATEALVRANASATATLKALVEAETRARARLSAEGPGAAGGSGDVGESPQGPRATASGPVTGRATAPAPEIDDFPNWPDDPGSDPKGDPVAAGWTGATPAGTAPQTPSTPGEPVAGAVPPPYPGAPDGLATAPAAPPAVAGGDRRLRVERMSL